MGTPMQFKSQKNSYKLSNSQVTAKRSPLPICHSDTNKGGATNDGGNNLIKEIYLDQVDQCSKVSIPIGIPSPIFGGSTGGLLRKAQLEEFYVIIWDSKKEQFFEMPTGGAAIMRQGRNLLKLSKKEQCLALTTQLRTKYKTDACFYRVFPNGEVQFLHPADGVYPEKVNKSRKGTNQLMRRIGQNTQPSKIKFSGKGPMDV